MRTVPNRLSAVWRGTRHVAEQSVAVLFIRVMPKRSTTSDHTGQAVWIMYQLGSLVVQRIDAVNHLTNLIEASSS